MEPTLYSNDILLTEHITPRFENIKKGDIVIAKSPSNPRLNVCKRVAGMPGDKIKLDISTHVVCYTFKIRMIKNILTRRKESDTYLATVSRHRWIPKMMLKIDEI